MELLQKLYQGNPSHFDRVVLFGPQLSFPVLCTVCTVEKLSMWIKPTRDTLDILVLEGRGLPRARLEGIMYAVTTEQLLLLDSLHGVGVNCRRKYIQVYTPKFIEPSSGQPAKISAWAYVSPAENWIERIKFETTVRRWSKELYQLDPVPDNNPIFHNRHSFYPQENGYGHVGTVSEKIRKNCKKRNKQEMRRLFFDRLRRDDL